MMRRYLVISNEQIIEGPKTNTHTHFDIIVAENADNAIEIVKRNRPNIDNIVHLSHNEVKSIHYAMLTKTDEEIQEKFQHNIGEKL